MAIEKRVGLIPQAGWDCVGWNGDLWSVVECAGDWWVAFRSIDLSTALTAINSGGWFLAQSGNDAHICRQMVKGTPSAWNCTVVSDADLDLQLDELEEAKPNRQPYFEELGTERFPSQASLEQAEMFIETELQKYRGMVARTRKAWPVCRCCGKEAKLTVTSGGMMAWYGGSSSVRVVLTCPEKE